MSNFNNIKTVLAFLKTDYKINGTVNVDMAIGLLEEVLQEMQDNPLNA